jgi:hypothetical protein
VLLFIPPAEAVVAGDWLMTVGILTDGAIVGGALFRRDPDRSAVAAGLGPAPDGGRNSAPGPTVIATATTGHLHCGLADTSVARPA